MTDIIGGLCWGHRLGGELAEDTLGPCRGRRNQSWELLELLESDSYGEGNDLIFNILDSLATNMYLE